MKAKVDQAENVDFSQFKTFAQAPPPGAQKTLPGYSEIEGRRMQEKIAQILEARGFRRVEDPQAADLYVSFSVTGQPRSDVWGQGGWGTYGGVAAGVSTTHYIQANLTINVYEAAERKLVWHGWTGKSFFEGQGDPDGAIEAVRTILAKFPTASGA
jgi:hypothetical protein